MKTEDSPETTRRSSVIENSNAYRSDKGKILSVVLDVKQKKKFPKILIGAAVIIIVQICFVVYLRLSQQGILAAEDSTLRKVPITVLKNTQQSSVRFAMLAFKGKMGRYPKSVEELTPDYLPELPVDVLTNERLVFDDERGVLRLISGTPVPTPSATPEAVFIQKTQESNSKRSTHLKLLAVRELEDFKITTSATILDNKLVSVLIEAEAKNQGIESKTESDETVRLSSVDQVKKIVLSDWSFIEMDGSKFAGNAQGRIFVGNSLDDKVSRYLVPAYMLGSYDQKTGTLIARISIGHNKEKAIRKLEIKEEKVIVSPELVISQASSFESHFEVTAAYLEELKEQSQK